MLVGGGAPPPPPPARTKKDEEKQKQAMNFFSRNRPQKWKQMDFLILMAGFSPFTGRAASLVVLLAARLACLVTATTAHHRQAVRLFVYLIKLFVLAAQPC